MKTTEIVLVIENWKGTERNFLMTLPDYISYMNLDTFDSRKEVANFMIELGRTSGEEKEWTEMYTAVNKSVASRFCNGEGQLTQFLEGLFNSSDHKFQFDEERCSDSCLNKLAELGMNTKGKLSYGSLSFTKWYTKFESGQVFHNFNGSEYRVMEKLSDKNLIVMDTATGRFIAALGTELYARHLRGSKPTEENSVFAIEWGHGIYLGNTLSAIDFRHIRQTYGTERMIEDIFKYRQMLEDRFRLYERLSKDELAGDALKEAVLCISYEEFGTQEFESFHERLQAGDYDDGFVQMQAEKKEKSR